MSQSMPRTVSQDSADGIRKRVCKACDRCRLKKSKCDGSHPCSRCRADNAICVFGERKKSHDKVYPKGYVEMLEQQQSQLVCGLQEMYRRLNTANAWTGATLSEASGHPLTHDILAALNLLEAKRDGSGDMELFEDDCQLIQDRLLAQGAGYVQRRGSISSESEHSSRTQHSRHVSHDTPVSGATPHFRETFSFGSPTSSPTSQSPMQSKATMHRPSMPFYTHSTSNTRLQQQFLHQVQRAQSPLTNDPQLYQSGWAIPDMSTPEQVLRAKLARQASMQSVSYGSDGTMNHLQQHSVSSQQIPVPLAMPPQQTQLYRQAPLFEQQQFDLDMSTAFGDVYGTDLQMSGFMPGLLLNNAVDFSTDSMETEFNRFISVTT